MENQRKEKLKSALLAASLYAVSALSAYDLGSWVHQRYQVANERKSMLDTLSYEEVGKVERVEHLQFYGPFKFPSMETIIAERKDAVRSLDIEYNVLISDPKIKEYVEKFRDRGLIDFPPIRVMELVFGVFLPLGLVHARGERK